MMRTIALEIRDRATFIPVIATKVNPSVEESSSANYLLKRSGYGYNGAEIILSRLNNGDGKNSSYGWNDRTFSTAHDYIQEHFDELQDGAVIDVEYILGETSAPKESEAKETSIW